MFLTSSQLMLMLPSCWSGDHPLGHSGADTPGLYQGFLSLDAH